MHCCRLSHPWVYKVGKMSSTLNVHGGGMQRWCSSNNTDREHLNARRVRLYLWYLLISTIFSYYTLNNSPTTEFAGTFFWCHRVSATEIQGKPIYRNEKEKEWRDARMLICIFAQIVKMLLAPGTMQSDCGVSTQTSRVWPVWSHLTWNTEEGEALVWTFTWKRK